MINTTTLKEGTTLYHGTSVPEFAEAEDHITGPAWFTTSWTVATHFATRHSGGSPRILVFRLTEELELPEILSSHDMEQVAEAYDVCFGCTEEIVESVACSSLAGWIIPYNYPDGDDILLANTSVVEYLRTEVL